jgi:hypothetical protein
MIETLDGWGETWASRTDENDGFARERMIGLPLTADPMLRFRFC